MALAPKISWYESSNEDASKVTGVVDYGVTNADDDSVTKTFYIWNNRAGADDCVKAEDIKFTTRDRLGGLGDSSGNIVEAVKDNWFKVRVDSMDEVNFTKVGKGGVGSGNVSGLKEIGTKGSTKNLNADTAIPHSTSLVVSLNEYIKPTTPNGFIYQVTMAGTMDSVEPTWLLTEGFIVESGTAQLTAVPIEKTPNAGELLGMANNTLEDGSNAADAGGNFAEISVYAEVPVTASSGLNQLTHKIFYKHL